MIIRSNGCGQGQEMSKLLRYLVSIAIVFSIMASCAPAYAASSGKCGDNITWSLSSSGTLTVSGTGSMWDYDSSSMWSKSRIKRIVIQPGVASISMQAFSNCTNLTSVTISDTVRLIGTEAFGGCSSLPGVVLPSGIKEMGWGVFYDCPLLCTAGPMGGDYDIQFSWTADIPKNAFNGCGSLTNIRIPYGITSLGDNVFKDCIGLTEITIPGSVESIGMYAFSGCIGLTDVKLPNSVESLGARAFSNCSRLESLSLPSGLTTLDYSVCYGCSSLKSITLPGSLTSIGSDAFGKCVSLTDIVIPDGVTYIGAQTFSGCSSLASISLPNSLDTIGFGAFKGCKVLERVVFPNTMTRMDGALFSGCSSLTSVTLPPCLTVLGSDFFLNCGNLEEVTLPEGLTSISFSAFRYCSSLKRIDIPRGVARIDNHAFSECLGLEEIRFNGFAPDFGVNSFYSVAAKAYYPPDSTWTDDKRQRYGGYLTWTPDQRPVINNDPTPQLAALGNRVTMSVSASDAQSYQWQYSRDGRSWTDCSSSGAKNAEFSFKPAASYEGRLYRCIVTNEAGSRISSPALLSIMRITAQPQSVETEAGKYVSLMIDAQNAESYQWQYSDDGLNWKNCRSQGFNTPFFRFKAYESLNNRQYRCKVMNGDEYLYSNAAKLTIAGMQDTEVRITSQPQPQTVTGGRTGVFSVSAKNALAYRWQFSKDGGSTWINCTAESSDTDTFSFIAESRYSGRIYRCRVTGTDGKSVFSDTAELTVVAAGPKITSQPYDITAVNGKTAFFEVSASGTGLKYRWQFSKDGGSTWTNCTAESADTDTFTFIAAGKYSGRLYRCRVTDAGGKSVFSEPAELAVIVKPAIVLQPEDITASVGETTGFEISASGIGLKYRWQFSKNGGSTWTNCTAVTSDTDTFTFTASSAYSGRLYRCRVANAAGTIVSDPVSLTVID